MNAAESRGSEDVELMSTFHAQGPTKSADPLHAFAVQRITLDLDDVVKVNYGKFGDLLAEVKMVTGEKDEE
jgi:transcription antitermination factor NusG